MASVETNQWLFAESELLSTPSVLDKLPIIEERCRRAKGVNFIIQAGILLKLPQPTLATASVFFHRFYMRTSMVPERGGLHHYNIAATALFLATKTEENCRKTKEIVIAVAKVAQKNASLIIDEQSKEYWRWRDNILLYEELLLEYLTFDVVLDSPYSFLYDFLHKFRVEGNKQLRNVAWAFLNDSCLTMLCLAMSAKDIAIAGLYFAAKFTEEKIPDDEIGEPWWAQLGGRGDLIIRAVEIIYEFYTENPLKRNENPYAPSPSSTANEEDLDRTRIRNRSFSQATPSPEQLDHSQRSQNGHAEQAQTDGENPPPASSGPKSPPKPSTQATEETLQDPQQPPIPETSACTSAQPADDLGSSDAALKEAANDPATHVANNDTNGAAESVSISAPVVSDPIEPTPKRKAEDAEEPAAKKQKVIDDNDAEQAEEGELEE